MNCTNLDELPMTLTVDEVAKVLRIGRNNAYHLIQAGNIRCVRCGRKIMIPRSALATFLSGGSEESH